MKYEEPKLELIELVEREVFMTASPEGNVNIGGSGEGGIGGF